MNLYEVRYSVGSSTATQWQVIQIPANSPNAAKELVESMFGGRSNCQTFTAVEVR